MIQRKEQCVTIQYLINEETGDRWEGSGGYYTAITGEVFDYAITLDRIRKTKQKNMKMVEIVEVYFSIQNGGDGSAYPFWFLTYDESEYDQENLYEGWVEPCIGSVETFVGSDIYEEALKNSKDQKNKRLK